MWTPEDQRLYNVSYYAEHRDEEIERVRVRQAAPLEFLRDLRRRPCKDCGQSFPPWVMDFDHHDPKTNSFALAADKVLLKARDVLLAEIAKCDVVCANCHAIRTYKWIKSEDVFASRPKGMSRHLARKNCISRDSLQASCRIANGPVPRLRRNVSILRHAVRSS